jgi:8-oxo-dGTP pyrophosphatase MutT (NUDIX family)
MDRGARCDDAEPDLKRFFGAACLLFSGTRLVLEVRKPHKWLREPGRPIQVGIGCSGGTIEADETPVQALKQEAEEEIGCAIDLWSARCTADVSPKGANIHSDLEIDGLKPAMVWEVTHSTYDVGSKVAVFLGCVAGDPQPLDLPAVVLVDPELVFQSEFESMSIAQVRRSGVEVRERITLPGDGRFQLANTLSRLRNLRSVDKELVDKFVGSDAAGWARR